MSEWRAQRSGTGRALSPRVVVRALELSGKAITWALLFGVDGRVVRW